MVDNLNQLPAFYSFEEQFEIAEAWARSNNKSLFKISDWNFDPRDVSIPNNLIQEAINDSLHTTTQYAETSVLIEACKEIRNNLKVGYDVNFDTDSNIHLFGNATQAIFGVMYSLKEVVQSPLVLLIHPSYYSVQDSASQCGIQFFEMWRKKKNGFVIDLEIIEHYRRKHAINILVLTDPVYSAGTCMDTDQWYRLIDYCKVHEIWLVIDMAFSGLSWIDIDKVWLDRGRLLRWNYRRVILIDSPAKRLFTNNLKIGLVFADMEIIDKLRDFTDWLLGNLTGLQVSFAKTLFKPENRELVENLCKTNVNRAVTNYKKLENIVSDLQNLKLFKPDAGFHTLLFYRGALSRYVDAMKACQGMVEKLEILPIPTNDFFFDHDDEFGIRLNLMCSSEKWMPLIKQIDAYGIPV